MKRSKMIAEINKFIDKANADKAIYCSSIDGEDVLNLVEALGMRPPEYIKEPFRILDWEDEVE